MSEGREQTYIPWDRFRYKRAPTCPHCKQVVRDWPAHIARISRAADEWAAARPAKDTG